MSSRRFTRRGARGVTRSGALTFAQKMNALTPYSMLLPSAYTADGSNAGAFVDQVTAGTGIRAITADHQWAQASGALQVAAPTADALLNNKLAAVFNAASYYDSSSAASSWAFLHDGSGSDFVYVLNRTSVAAGTKYHVTTNTGAAPEGFIFRHNGTTVTNIACNATTTVVNRAGAAAATGAWFYRMGYKNGAATETWFYDKSSLRSSGADLAAPSAAASATTMRIGALPAGTSKAIMNVGAMIWWNRALTAGEWTTVQTAILAEFGVS